MDFYWLNLFGFVLLTVLAGLFTRILFFSAKPPLFASICENARTPDHAYLCGKKISVHDANVNAWARVPRVSVTTARKIRAFLRARPEAGLDELRRLKDIGPKSIEKFREHFF